MKRDLIIITAITFIFSLSYSLITPYIPTFLDEVLGAASLVVGIVVAIYPLSEVFLRIPIGAYSDYFGYKRFIAIGYFVQIFCGLLLFAANTSILVVVAQLIRGFGVGCVWVTSQAYATNVGPEEELGTTLGAWFFFNASGFALGPFLGNRIILAYGYQSLFLVFTLIIAVGVLASFFLKEQETKGEKPTIHTVKKDLGIIIERKGVPQALLFTFLAGFNMGMFTSFLPVYLKEIGMAASLGLLLSLRRVAYTGFVPLIGKLGDEFGYEKVIIASGIVGIIFISLLPLSNNIYYIIIVLSCWSMTHGAFVVLPTTIIGRHVSNTKKGLGMGLRTTIYMISWVIGPIIFGAASEKFDISISFYILAGIFAVGLLLYPLIRDEEF